MNDKNATASKKHSKKRNVGLMYEFLLRTISRSLVENDAKRSGAALRVIKKHFKPGTELYREFRLFNSLIKTTVTSDAVAMSIVNEAKLAARAIDVAKLEKEKTFVLHEVNRFVADESFYDQPINEYKIYATIGTLFTAWRDPFKYDLSKITAYEEKLIEWLRLRKDSTDQLVENSDTPGVNRLIFKIMTKKLNEKYGAVLDESQKSLVREYALYSVSGSEDNVRNKLVEIRSNLLETIKRLSDPLPAHTNTKLDDAKKMVESEVISMIDDETVSRHMSYIKLTNELRSVENKDDQA